MPYVVGIDLHGTLLDDEWEIKPHLHSELIESMRAVTDSCRIFVCSGNDLSFIHRYVPADVRSGLSGYVLETGCILSDGITENAIVPDAQVRSIKELEKHLEETRFPEVKYFGRRLCTISLFTRTEIGGSDPADLHPRVESKVRELGFQDEVLVTHSNVAVDILPIGFTKFSGIRHVAVGLKTIGIADSLNDIHLLTDADLSFMPANGSQRLIDTLESVDRRVRPLSEWQGDSGPIVWRSRFPSTQGVIEILRFLKLYLR
jgi:hydroxymethylpyrimidine pyrophosphatase-like HAD family hydrolase